MTNDRPFVDGINIHDVESIEIKAHPEAHCVSINLTGPDGAFSTLVINIWRGDHATAPRVVVNENVLEASA